MYQHYVFDIDGTLIDSEAAAMRSLQRVVQELQGRELSLDYLYQAFGISAGDTMVWLGIEDAEKGLQLWHQYIQELWTLTRVFDGVRLMLEKLKAQGATLGLLTSKSRFEFDHDFIPMGIAEYFDVSITAVTVKPINRNPDPCWPIWPRPERRPKISCSLVTAFTT